jgi:hydrogenase maturation protein HypF
MKLEALAAEGSALDVGVPRATADGRPVVDTPRLFADLVDATAEGAAGRDVAATAQEALASGLTALAVEAARDRGRETVVLSGGVAYNSDVARRIREQVEAADLEFLGNERVPPGDGGVAYGQAVVAAARAER